MDIGTKIQLPQPTSSSAPNSRSDVPVFKKSEVMAEPVQIPSVPNIDMRAADERRMQTIKQNAQSGPIFAVSDHTFTIYKDTSGQYITRYTSLRDGSITYVPEAELTKNAPDAMFQLQA